MRRFSDTLVADPNVAISGAVCRRHLLFWISDGEGRGGGARDFCQREFSSPLGR